MEIAVRHELFSSLEEMLSPQVLGRLASRPVTRVKRVPLVEHDGVAGGILTRITTDAGSFVLKQMDISYDWGMVTTNDQRCRAVALWQYGLLDDLQERFHHKILACSCDSHGWAILMEDLGERVYHWARNPIPGHLIEPLLDSLAWQHARYWNRDELLDERIDLCSMAEYLDTLNRPAAVRVKEKDNWGKIPGWLRRGLAGVEELLDKKTFRQVMDLSENPAPLLAAIERYPATLFHGDCRQENIGYDTTFVLLDWQLATFSLPTAGLGWVTGNGFIIDKFGDEETAFAYYRSRLETRLNDQLADEDWEAMLDLGLAVNALRSIWLNAFFFRNDENEDGIAWNRSRVHLNSRRVMRAYRWF